MRTPVPLISFTFDDFPASALTAGGTILQRFGARGTYYAALGLMGQRDTPTGTIFLPEAIPQLLADGHELGCHTFAHCDSWETAPATFHDSVVRNAETLDRLVPGARFSTLSYPISPPRPWTKRRIAARFAGCRGGGQRFNTGTIDLNYLSAFFLEQARDRPEAIDQVLRENVEAGGWLIFATHDVAETPTPYGCTPREFERVVAGAVASGAKILPVGEVLRMLGTSQPAAS